MSSSSATHHCGTCGAVQVPTPLSDQILSQQSRNKIITFIVLAVIVAGCVGVGVYLGISNGDAGLVGLGAMIPLLIAGVIVYRDRNDRFGRWSFENFVKFVQQFGTEVESHLAGGRELNGEQNEKMEAIANSSHWYSGVEKGSRAYYFESEKRSLIKSFQGLNAPFFKLTLIKTLPNYIQDETRREALRIVVKSMIPKVMPQGIEQKPLFKDALDNFRIPFADVTLKDPNVEELNPPIFCSVLLALNTEQTLYYFDKMRELDSKQKIAEALDRYAVSLSGRPQLRVQAFAKGLQGVGNGLPPERSF